MWKTFVLRVTSLMMSSAAIAGGGVIKGGGNTVECTLSSKNSYYGLYALDFILTDSPLRPKLADVKSWEQSAQRIHTLLQQKLPKIALSFKEFADLVDNHNRYFEPRIWIDKVEKLKVISDVDPVQELPENCGRQPDGAARYIQTVVRVKTDTLITYNYHASTLDRLREEAPLQFSFLMVHEWLWDYFQADQQEGMRHINHLLHSALLDDLTAEQLAASLENLGIPASELASGDTAVEDSESNLPEDANGGKVLAKSFGISAPKLALGYNFTCRLNQKNLTCWGEIPVDQDHVQLDDVIDVTSSPRSLCVLQKKNGPRCWGTYLAGYDWIPVRTPDILQNRNDFVSIRTNGADTCVVKKGDDRLVLCANIDDGRIDISPLPGTLDITMGREFFCAQQSQGAQCFLPHSIHSHLLPTGIRELSANPYDQPMALATTKSELHISDMRNAPFKPIYKIDAPDTSLGAMGKSEYCFESKGRVRCGFYDNSHIIEPKLVFLCKEKPVQIAVSHHHGCSISASSNVCCWGEQTSGEVIHSK